MNNTELQAEVTILRIFEYMLANNCNRRQACKALGVSYISFNRKLAESPHTLTDLLSRQKETLSTNLTQLLISQQELLKNLMKKASDPDLDVNEMISLNKHLMEIQSNLSRGLGVETQQEKDAKAFLTGAILRPGTAKIVETTKTTEFTIEQDPPLIDIIDAQIVEKE